MKQRVFVLTMAWAAASVLTFSQTKINAIENDYSGIFPGLPNYGIAQGSIFVIYGSGFGAGDSGLQSPPLQTSLNAVSVQIAVAGVTTQALLYYVAPTQIAGILPSATGAGEGTLTVSLNGVPSASAPITVVPSAFGIATDGSVSQAAAAYDANARALAATNSANPGDTITLWGTGLGPVQGNESIPQPQSLAGIPVEVDIGGVAASVPFHGRSQYPGLDQINVVIPMGLAGCWVSVVVRTGNLVSNSATIPIAAGGRTCSDPGFGPVQILSGKPVYNTGGLSITKSHGLGTGGAGVTVLDQVSAGFSSGPNSQLGYNAAAPSPGSCITHPFSWISRSAARAAAPRELDAGPALYFGGENGLVTLAPAQGSQVAYDSSTAAPGFPPFIPDSGGVFTISNGSGGSDVGPFFLLFHAPPPFEWTNLAGLTAIDRSQGYTIAWTGGDPNGVVLIDGTSYSSAQTGGVQLFCAALVSAHQFTIPASTLLAMPPAQPAAAPQGGLSPFLTAYANKYYLFSAPGLDGGIFTFGSGGGTVLTFR